MRIVIDMQGAQSTGSRHRGIGRYTQSLVGAIARHRGAHDVVIALNGAFAASIGPIRAAFDGVLPPERIVVWNVPGPVAGTDGANAWRRKTGELMREAFLTGLHPDVVLVTSLFEGLSDDAVTSIGTLARTVPTAVILYDLIPLIQRRHYLANPVVARWYENKLDHLRRADLLLAISESSRQEGMRHLGFPDTACVTVSTAADPHFRPIELDAARATAIRTRYGLRRPFVMYTGGIDHRKNIEGLVRAYAMLPAPVRADYQLAIVCAIEPYHRTVLEQLARDHGLAAGDLVLTGFVPEDDLLALYNLCHMFVFPSWHEGFGLPALEAMSCGRAVIGADASSLPEVIGRADALFDPRSDEAIASKMRQVLTDDGLRKELERHGIEQAGRFSWEVCAQRALAALTAAHEARHAVPAVMPAPPARPTLAYVSPLPPERSGIADYSAELLPELARHYDIDLVTPQERVADPWIAANCAVRHPDWLRAHADRYDRVLYHVGNSEFHQHMFDLLEEVPGVVVLHDFFLSGVVAHMERTGYRPGYWTDSLYGSHGYPAVRERFRAADGADVVWRYPANLSVLRGALGMIVHSEHARRLARAWYPGDESDGWAVIPHLRVPETGPARAEARRALRLRDDEVVVCSFGLLGPTKLNHRLLDAWLASALARDARCVLVFVGENQQGEYGRALSATIRHAGVGERIRITGWTDMAVFRHYLAAADIGVQLRTLSRGETSGTVLDCMNHGLATIVNANGSMADLPDDGVVKLADDFGDADLVAALESLWRDGDRRARLGERARALIRSVHAPRGCADRYAQAIERAYRGATHRGPALTRALARVTPAPADDEAWVALAYAVTRLQPPRFPIRQLLVDVSALHGAGESGMAIDLGTFGSLHDLLARPPEGCRVEPVRLADDGTWHHARRFALRLLDCPETALEDGPADLRPGDVMLVPGTAPDRTRHDAARHLGVEVRYVG